MYQRLVGEGGMMPQYFMQSLTLSEANDYIKGQDRRGRASWEQTRAIVNAICSCMAGDTPDWEFPWDDERTPEEKAAEQAKKAEDFKRLEAYADWLNKQNKNKQ